MAEGHADCARAGLAMAAPSTRAVASRIVVIGLWRQRPVRQGSIVIGLPFCWRTKKKRGQLVAPLSNSGLVEPPAGDWSLDQNLILMPT